MLLATVLVVGSVLAVWKVASAQDPAAAAGAQEPMEVVTEAQAREEEHRGATTSIGTVLAIRSVTLRNEVPGTVRSVGLESGRVVEAGTVLVALDVSVEEAELRAHEARAELARSTLTRYERMVQRGAASAIEVDNARAERDIALAEIARVRAIIDRKTIRAPFRSRVGIADVHPGQFLDAGTVLTTLQGVEGAVHVDFTVAQSVAAQLSTGAQVMVVIGDDDSRAVPARIAAVDARVDPTTRNAVVRARIDQASPELTPGASVRVRVPVGEHHVAVVVPVSALRRGPAGDHVFVIQQTEDGRTRAHVRGVQTGPVLGREVVIVSGLELGERVAASGSFKLWDGVLVSVAPGAGNGEAAGAGEEG